MTEEQPLKILFIEDMPEDLELAKRRIKNSGIEFESYLAETEEQFLTGLYEFKPDIIISDYLLPGFDGMRALEITLTYDDTIPFIILTGAANEEIIVDAMKAGANDYLVKERINRLPFAIQEAIKKRDMLQEGKKANDSLEFLSRVLEQSPYSVISTDMDGIIKSWNKGAENIFGYSAAEAINQHISFVYHEKDHEFLENEIIKPLIEKEKHQQQICMKHKNGESFTASSFLWLIKDRAGKPAGMVGYTLDITKTVKAEEELQIKNQAIEHDIDGIVIMDTDGKITYANKAALETLGYPSKCELVGRTIKDILDYEKEENGFLDKIKNHGLKSELVIRRKDKSKLPVWLSATNIKNESGKTISYMCSFVDITEMKKAEEDLRENEKLFRLLAENTLDCIWIMDMNLTFTYVNPAIYYMLGFTQEEWVGSKLNDHCTEDNFNKMMKYVRMGIEMQIISPE
ncbi:MAG: PAS domain S-box protein [Methanolobus sp.]